MIVPSSLSSGGLVRCNAYRTSHVAGDAVGGLLLSAVLEELLHPFNGLRRKTRRTSPQSSNPATRAQAPSARIPEQPRVTPAQGAAQGRNWRRRQGRGAVGGAEPGWRRQCGAGGGVAERGSAGLRG